MNRMIYALIAAITLFVGCGKSGDDPQKGQTEETKGFVADSWNAKFVEALAKAYDTFTETDELPATINVDGISYSKANYAYAAIVLLDRIIDTPDTWEDEDIEPVRYSTSVSDKWNTYDPNTISISDVRWMGDKLLAYAEEKTSYPNYVTFDTYYTESDGTQHSDKMTFNNAMVVFTRVFNYYVKNNELPSEVSSWGADFLHAVSNCPTDDETVLAAMNEAIAGCTTTREKAEALFNYSRDEWEWENYANTNRGAVKTIQAKAGNCCDLSHALIAMCRAAGIPARYMHGQCQFSSSIIGHVFVEIYVDGTWYICDPSNNSNQFGTHNWKHMDTFNGRYNELPF